MIPDQHEKLEQVAREWFKSQYMAPPLELVEELVALLAAQRVAVLEEAAKEIEQVPTSRLIGQAVNYLYEQAARLRQQAQEQP